MTFVIHVAADAEEPIRSRGGRIFIWNKPVGRMGVSDRISFEAPPPEIVFECRRDTRRNVEVCVALDVGPREVVIRSRKWPLRGVRVYVDGKRWGWRGQISPSPVA